MWPIMRKNMSRLKHYSFRPVVGMVGDGKNITATKRLGCGCSGIFERFTYVSYTRSFVSSYHNPQIQLPSFVNGKFLTSSFTTWVANWVWWFHQVLVNFHDRFEVLDQTYLVTPKLPDEMLNYINLIFFRLLAFLSFAQINDFHSFSPSSTASETERRKKKYKDIDFSILWFAFYILCNGVMVIVLGNEYGDTSSNSGRGWLHFT